MNYFCCCLAFLTLCDMHGQWPLVIYSLLEPQKIKEMVPFNFTTNTPFHRAPFFNIEHLP